MSNDRSIGPLLDRASLNLERLGHGSTVLNEALALLEADKPADPNAIEMIWFYLAAARTFLSEAEASLADAHRIHLGEPHARPTEAASGD